MSVLRGTTWTDTTDPILDALGDPIEDDEANITVTILDSNGVDRSAGATVTYLDVGIYQVSKAIPSDAATGNWTVVVVWDNGVATPHTYSGGFEVAVTSSASTSRASKTFAELIRLLADEFGDLTILTATALGTTTTMIDTKNISTASENLDGREITFITGVNAGLSRRITNTTDTSGTVTFAAVTGAVAAGVIADVVNRRGTGFLRDEYKRAINRAIDETSGSLIEMVGTVSDEFSQSDGAILVPETMHSVFKVEYESREGEWSEIKRAPRFGGAGWTAVAGEGLRVTGQPAAYANGRTVQLWGYGRQATLTADTDVCVVNKEFILAFAAYHLAKANLHRRPELGNLVMDWKDTMDREKRRMRRNRHPDTQAVWA